MNGRICCCEDLRTRNVLVKVIEETTGIAPNAKGNTSAAKRAYYAEAPARTIINNPSIQADARLNYPSAIDAYEVDDPTAAALKAEAIFRQYGYGDVDVIDDLEPELPKGFMVFVVVQALRGLVLLYWPKVPDEEAIRKFRESGDFGPWTAADGAID